MHRQRAPSPGGIPMGRCAPPFFISGGGTVGLARRLVVAGLVCVAVAPVVHSTAQEKSSRDASPGEWVVVRYTIPSEEGTRTIWGKTADQVDSELGLTG